MPYQYIPYLIFRIVNFGLEQFFTSINYAPFRVTLVQVLYFARSRMRPPHIEEVTE